MNTAMLIPTDSLGCPFPFFDEPKTYKVYNDGRHYIATECWRGAKRKPQEISTASHKCKDLTPEQREMKFRRILREKRNALKNRKFKNTVEKISLTPEHDKCCSREAKDMLFDGLFIQALKAGLRDTKYDKPMTEFIRVGILKLYPDFEDLDEFIANKIKRKYHNIGVRKKRFRRKAYLNRWNYFVTFTYDDAKHSEETFERKLRKCFSNLHTRRGWRIMGGFERAPETGRLHFHGVIYVPNGEMLGEITEKTDYSTAQKQMQTRNENSFFEKNFGRNDFEELGQMELQYSNTIDYILKYISKTNEKLYYSRGIPTEICIRLDKREIVTEFTDFVQKFVLFDDTIDWERDIMRYNKRKQMSIIDILCNPPKVA